MIKLKILILLAVLTFAACAPQRQPVPPGVIPTVNTFSRGEEAYGQKVLQELSKKYPVDRTVHLNQRVRSMVDRLAQAAKADNLPWYAYVLKGDDVLNAAATRGNHVFVWTGMLNFARSDHELAAVVAHELAHVLAGHTQPTPMEQVNQILVGVAGHATSSAVGSQASAIGGQLAATLAQALLVNPNSQRLELEADHIGLFMMARAGYNPEAAINLWQKMQQQQGSGDGVMAFLSTHPPSKSRIEEFKILMPQALRDYEQAKLNPAKSVSSNLQSGYYQPIDNRADNRTDNTALQNLPNSASVINARVSAPYADLFSRPNTNNRPLRRLNRGQRVKIARELESWVEISQPYRGFLRKRELRPEN